MAACVPWTSGRSRSAGRWPPLGPEPAPASLRERNRSPRAAAKTKTEGREDMRKRLIAAFALGAAFAAVSAPAQAPEPYSLATQRAKLARVVMHPNTAFLSAEERDVVNLLIRAAALMDPIYLRQMSGDNVQVRA